MRTGAKASAAEAGLDCWLGRHGSSRALTKPEFSPDSKVQEFGSPSGTTESSRRRDVERNGGPI